MNKHIFSTQLFHFPVPLGTIFTLLALFGLAPHPARCGEIHEAAMKCDLARVQALLKTNPELIKSMDDKGMSPLHRAAFAGCTDVAEFLIANHASVNARDGGGSPPLYYASVMGRKEMVELLLAKGADVNAKDNGDGTPLHFAALVGRRDVVSVLLAKGAMVNATATNGMTALHMASQQNQKEVASMLLAKGADVNAKDQDGMTPLLTAVANGSKDVAALLLANHADVNAQDNQGRNALLLVANGGNREMAELLLANKADVNSSFLGGVTPLHVAAASGNKAMVVLLLAHGADVDARDNQLGETPMGWAKERGKTEVAELLSRYAKTEGGSGVSGKLKVSTGSQQTEKNTEKYRALRSDDGLSCAFSQDISMSTGAGLSGTMSASANHFECKNKTGKEVEIELISANPSVNAGLENGKVAIRTKMFGTVYRGNQPSTFDTYEMTDSQIKRLKTYLGL